MRCREADVLLVSRRRFGESHRRGFLAPAIVVALLAVLLVLALVLDAWWLDNASVELTRASESAALAAGRELVTDDLLRGDSREIDERRIERARRKAVRIARRNRVAGERLQLDAQSQRDIRFGRLIADSHTGRTRFEERRRHPTTVVVSARRSRRNGNPIALFLRGITGQPSASLMRRAEATIDNHVVGVRPFEGAPVPMWPLAILEDCNSGTSDGLLHSWRTHIEGRLGNDEFAYDEARRRVQRRPDGIPEMILRCGTGGSSSGETNVKLVDVGNGLRVEDLQRQFRRGVTADDLKRERPDCVDRVRWRADCNSAANRESNRFVQNRIVVDEF